MRTRLRFEFFILFICIPLALAVHPTRMAAHICLWLISAYSIFVMTRVPGFSWRELWHGKKWPARHKKAALIRFIAATVLIVIFTDAIAPQRLFAFPVQRPGFWLLVMILYPILSALPQELVFRSYFHRRYATLFPTRAAMISINAFCFGLVHVMFHNWVSPLLSVIAGALFAWSYSQHRSLKWAAIEHAAYGCMIFTCGIGLYFLVGVARP
ncbi:MAG: CPBP family intramembrane glutamic endopeptidase [Bdellovibrionales bacterium]